MAEYAVTRLHFYSEKKASLQANKRVKIFFRNTDRQKNFNEKCQWATNLIETTISLYKLNFLPISTLSLQQNIKENLDVKE